MTSTVWDRAREALSALRAAPAVTVSAWTTDWDGRLSHGRFTVTADGSAWGSVVDQWQGTAQYVATGGQEAVHADEAWWGHRAPRVAEGASGRWVRPEPGLAFPVDVASALNPGALADVVDALLAEARESDDDEEDKEKDATLSGRRVRKLVSGEWTLHVAADGAAAIVRMAGPVLADGPMRPALPALRAQVAPPRDTLAGAASPRVDETAYRLPYLAIEPVQAGDEAVEAVRQAIATTLASLARAAPTSPGVPSPPEAPSTDPSTHDSAPPEQSREPLPASFAVEVLASTSTTTTCSWSVVVTNTGGGPGRGTVYATAKPGMDLVAQQFGPLAPGHAATFSYTFPSPAPLIPGHTVRMTVSYEAWVENDSPDGPDPAVSQRLAARGIDQDSIVELQQDDGAFRPVAERLLDLATAQVPPGSTQGRVNERAIAATRNMIRYGLLAEVRAILESGRLADPTALVGKLERTRGEIRPHPNYDQVVQGLGCRRQIQQAASVLRDATNGTVHLDTDFTDPRDGRIYRTSLIVRGTQESYQVKSLSAERDFLMTVKAALRQLNGCAPASRDGLPENSPPGYKRIAVIYLEPSTGTLHQASRADLAERVRRLRGFREEVRPPDGPPRADVLYLSNAAGAHRWEKAEFDDLLG